MKNKCITLLCLSFSALYAQTYTTTADATAESKNLACSKALQNAKVIAMEEAGTLVFSNFSATTSDNNGKVSQKNQHELITTALGVAKLHSKSESVHVTKEYQFHCEVEASFEINQSELEETLQEMVQKQQKEKNLEAYFYADGYSEENQSRYKAFTSATMLAQRNLLESIKGADITSLTKISDAKVEVDKIAKLLSGTLQGAEIVKKEYDHKTRSAYVKLRVKKQNVVEALDDKL